MFERITMQTVYVAGLKLQSATKAEALSEIKHRLAQSQKTTVITPYSEFLLAGLRDKEFMALLNQATLSLPDGIGILWANKFLSVPLSAQGYYAKIIQVFWQMVWTGASILLYPRSLYSVFPEKIVGADFFWDLLGLAEAQGFSVYLLGGEGDVPVKATRLIAERFPRLKVLGSTNKIWDDPSIVTDINALRPDMTFVFFPYRKQERWIFRNINHLETKFIIGLGGTLDYAVGEKVQPPRFIRRIGLEWLFRLITQPQRVPRIWNASVGLITALIRYKVFLHMPYRNNAVAVIKHTNGSVLVCQRNPMASAYGKAKDSEKKFVDYWQFPQGGVDETEDLVTAAKREAAEEVGLYDLRYIRQHNDAYRYEWQNALRRLLFNPLKFIGQCQNLIYFSYDGPQNAVQLDNKEFTDYQWVEPGRLMEVLHPERHVLAEIVVRDLQ